MEIPHRVFTNVQTPWLPSKRRKYISRAIVQRKYGLTVSEINKAQKRRERKLASSETGEGGDEGRLSEDEEEEEEEKEENILQEQDIIDDEKDIEATETLVQQIKERLSMYKEQKKQLLALVRQLIKEEPLRTKLIPPPSNESGTTLGSSSASSSGSSGRSGGNVHPSSSYPSNPHPSPISNNPPYRGGNVPRGGIASSSSGSGTPVHSPDGLSIPKRVYSGSGPPSAALHGPVSGGRDIPRNSSNSNEYYDRSRSPMGPPSAHPPRGSLSRSNTGGTHPSAYPPTRNPLPSSTGGSTSPMLPHRQVSAPGQLEHSQYPYTSSSSSSSSGYPPSLPPPGSALSRNPYSTHDHRPSSVSSSSSSSYPYPSPSTTGPSSSIHSSNPNPRSNSPNSSLSIGQPRYSSNAPPSIPPGKNISPPGRNISPLPHSLPPSNPNPNRGPSSTNNPPPPPYDRDRDGPTRNNSYGPPSLSSRPGGGPHNEPPSWNRSQSSSSSSSTPHGPPLNTHNPPRSNTSMGGNQYYDNRTNSNMGPSSFSNAPPMDRPYPYGSGGNPGSFHPKGGNHPATNPPPLPPRDYRGGPPPGPSSQRPPHHSTNYPPDRGNGPPPSRGPWNDNRGNSNANTQGPRR